MAGERGAFLEYHEPDVISILTIVSFFLFLVVSEWLADKVVRAGLIGQIVVGMIYGIPIGNILALDWQQTFLALGYIGLILIIFDGGLTIRLDLLRQNFLLSVVAALIGVLTPIALSFALLHAGFGHSGLEAFIVGTALCSTSLGTTFVVINKTSRDIDFAQTRIGTVLISAAVLDDVCGLVLVSVIHQLRGIADGGGGLGWVIGRPILASGLMALVTPLAAKFLLGPVFRRVGPRFVKFGHAGNITLMIAVLCAFLAIAAYAGASVLFGAFLAGTVVSSLPSQGELSLSVNHNTDEINVGNATFTHTFEKYVGNVQRFILQPLFFASIGFAIPFLDLWTGEMIWKGIVFAVLMALSKLAVGAVVPIWVLLSGPSSTEKPSAKGSSWPAATLLGMAMVARGEIGLLIIQIGLNETPYLSQKAFIVAVWAIVLNTVIGPVCVGILLGSVGQAIADDSYWGRQPKGSPDVRGFAHPAAANGPPSAVNSTG
ncbi:hypothetical protein OQA88_9545 [Cercophora sp. LCS_1]